MSTTGLCMGVNFPNIGHFVRWGAAQSILDLHQEAGKAGRDGLQSHVIELYHGQKIGPSEQEVKDFVRSQECLRVAAYQSLDSAIMPLNPHMIAVPTVLLCIIVEAPLVELVLCFLRATHLKSQRNLKGILALPLQKIDRIFNLLWRRCLKK